LAPACSDPAPPLDRLRLAAGFHARSAAERHQVGEGIESQKVGFVERTHTCLAEPTVNAERLATKGECLAEPAREVAADDQITSADRSRLVDLEPAQHGKILPRVEGNHIRGLPID
jgi:hypothetical protein